MPRFESLGPHTLSTFFPDSFDTHLSFWTTSVHSHSFPLNLRNRFGDLFNSIHSKETPLMFTFMLGVGKPGLQWKIVWLVKTFQWPNLFCNYLKKSYSNNGMMRSHGYSFHGISKSCQIRFFLLSWPYPPEINMPILMPPLKKVRPPWIVDFWQKYDDHFEILQGCKLLYHAGKHCSCWGPFLLHLGIHIINSQII